MIELLNNVLTTIGIVLIDIVLLAIVYRMITGKRLDFGLVVTNEITTETEAEETAEAAVVGEAAVEESSVGTDEEPETTEEAEAEPATEPDSEQIAALAAKVATLASEVSTLAAKTDAKNK